ncbi:MULTISPECIES: ATP-binding protein [Clostridium]|jgi:tRNA 2-thiocytidine biosynthesis protein TtcA|nr:MULTISPECIES: ATP-binding protein [Clostridium]MBD9273993.1 ATPase [Clostridium sp.]MCC2169448.1 ATPase [Clostridium fessum]RHP43400.1 ATPase [Clostridium sp. AF32-7AC]RHQ69761.1 ATPase [Clostridium sp. AF24-2LB]RHS69503.1 ATPase [Clostridium sp. AM43-3BH]
MKTITIEELEALKDAEKTIVDIRPQDQYMRGTFPGAVSLPASRLEEQYEEETARLDKMHPVYVMCHTGEKSQEWVRRLTGDGFDAVNVEGGYRAWLRLSLSRFVGGESEADREEKRARIEQSIIKKFRKPIWRAFTRALNTYDLIQEGDKIAVCISGGKDSMLMAKLFQELKKHGKFQFETVFLVMNPGYNADNWKIIQDNAKLLGIPLTVFESDIFDTVATIEQNPCYLCARMRRGHLYAQAKALGCNKIALGHHFDDVIETILMGMLYSGKIETMMPKLHSQNFEGMELIRPMYLIKEDAVKAWRDYNGLQFIQCACRFTENCVSCGGGRGSKRDEMKELIAHFRKESDVIEKNIFKSVHNINLKTVIGYHRDDWTYNFLDDYNDKK